MSHWQDRLAAYQAGEHELPAFRKALGFDLKAFLKLVEPGHVVYEWPVDAVTYDNSVGRVFGGYLSALADDVATLTIMSILDDDEGFTTADLHINYFKPVMEGTLKAESRIVNRSRSSAYIEIDLTLDDGTLAARSTATMLILKNRPKKA